jgi:hypothetical protein
MFIHCVERADCIFKPIYSLLFEIATFLSKEIGTLGEQVEDDPFLEILTAKRGMDGTSSKRHELVKQQLTPVSLFYIDALDFKLNN